MVGLSDSYCVPCSGKAEPLVLLVPGLGGSGPDHWQSYWERELACERVDLGRWDDPHRNTWVNKLNLAIHRARRPVILVAHSLGCHVVAWWNEYERPGAGSPVLGALLVAPPDVEGDGVIDPRLARFAPVMRTPLPFPSIVAASRDDPYMAFGRSRRLARIWKSRFIDAGWLGHINAESGIGSWPFGQFLLRQLKSELAREPVPVRGPHHAALAAARLEIAERW